MTSRPTMFEQMWVWIETPGMTTTAKSSTWEQRFQRLEQTGERLKLRPCGKTI